MPLTMAAFFIGSLSIIGLPPTGGMWSKWYLMLGALETEMLVLMVVLMVSSLLNIAYLLSIPVRAFFPGETEESATSSAISEAPLPSLLAIGFTSLACIVLFFWPTIFLDLAQALVDQGQ
jgi:multicomponent Na+:H+ antiporter subunit D